MLILKQIAIFFLGLVIVLSFFLFLSLSLHKPKLEWDIQNSEIHGEIVVFKDDMSYINLNEEHKKYGFNAEEISLKKVMVETQSQEYDLILSYGGTAESIPKGTVFIIKNTFTTKYNWITSSFNDDVRFAFVESSDCVTALVSLYKFATSTRPDFCEDKWLNGEIE